MAIEEPHAHPLRAMVGRCGGPIVVRVWRIDPVSDDHIQRCVFAGVGLRFPDIALVGPMGTRLVAVGVSLVLPHKRGALLTVSPMDRRYEVSLLVLNEFGVIPQHSRTRNAMVGAWANRGLEIAEVYRTAVRTAVRVRWRRWRRPRMQQIQAIVSVRPIAIEVYVLLVVVGVHHHRNDDLANVGATLHAIGAFLRFLERGQEDGDQEGDDADDNEQLDQSKCATPHKMPPFYPVHPDVTKTKSSTSGRSRQRMRKDFAARGGGNKARKRETRGGWDHRVRFSA